MKFTSLIFLSALCGSTLAAQAMRVAHDPRAEMIGVMFRIAGAPDFSNGAQLAYNRQIDSTFAPFKSHNVFGEISRLRREYRLSLSAVTTMAPQITDPISFAERAPIDAPSATLSGAWRGAGARTFLEYARDFARVAPVSAFLRREQPLYDSATVRMRRLVEKGNPEWFRQFFGEPPGDVFVVSPLLVNSGGNFAADFMDGATHERYAFIGVTLIDSAGFPAIAADVLATVIHEFSHSFVNHVVDAHSSDFRASGEPLFRAVEPQMRALAYTSWPNMLNESVVRAVVIRYLLANEGKTAADNEQSRQRGLGFVWMDELVALLGQYESQRSAFPTFESFMPKIVEYYNGLVPRLDRVKADFEARRPTIASSSIRDSAQSVDPGTTTLVLRFSRPVDAIVELVGNHGGNTPILTAATFNTTHTTLTLGIKLEPGREYLLPLGGGAFVSRDGYPLQMFALRFKTTGLPKFE